MFDEEDCIADVALEADVHIWLIGIVFSHSPPPVQVSTIYRSNQDAFDERGKT